VPEAAVHKDYLSMRDKDDVGLAGQFRGVQSIPESHRVDQAAHIHFRARISALDCSHAVRALDDA